MSLRDDLDKLANEDWDANEAYDRLKAIITPAAEVWLAALPALMNKYQAAVDHPGYFNLSKEEVALEEAMRNALASAKAAGEAAKGGE